MPTPSSRAVNVSAQDSFIEAIAEAVAAKLRAEGLGGGKRLLNCEAAAEYLGMTTDALRAKVANRHIQCVRVDRHFRFDVRDLDRWIEENKTSG